MRKLLKFLHTIGAVAYLGGLAAYVWILMNAPSISNLDAYAALRSALAETSTWLLLPGLFLVLINGLLAMIDHKPFFDQLWVWVKAVTGLLLFESTPAAVDALAERAAEVSSRALPGEIDATALSGSIMTNGWPGTFCWPSPSQTSRLVSGAREYFGAESLRKKLLQMNNVGIRVSHPVA